MRHNVAQRRRALIWGAALPLVTLLGAVFLHPLCLALLALYPLQILRLGWRSKDPVWAAFVTLAKIPEALGVAHFYRNWLFGRRGPLIEYK